MKRILVIKTDGTEYTLDKHPSLKEMQKIVGGLIEHVTVIDRVENGRVVYTSMIINEEGLLTGLPRNEKATVIFQRNVRHHYPESKNPFRDAYEDWRRSLPADFAVIDGTPPEAKARGYDDNPFIVGDAIYFEGYNDVEVNDSYEAAHGKE